MGQLKGFTEWIWRRVLVLLLAKGLMLFETLRGVVSSRLLFTEHVLEK